MGGGGVGGGGGGGHTGFPKQCISRKHFFFLVNSMYLVCGKFSSVSFTLTRE